MKNLTDYELEIIKKSLQLNLSQTESFLRGNYGHFTDEEEEKLKIKTDTIKNLLLKIDK